MREVYLELALNELNVKCFFTDAREFKRKGDTKMFNLAVAHIKRMKREMESARAHIREYNARGGRNLTIKEWYENQD